MKYVLLFLSFFATSTFAAVLGPDNVNTNTNLNSANAMQGQAQGQFQGQGQAQSTIVSNRISNDVRTNAAAFAGAGSLSNSSSGGNTLVVNEAPIPASTYQEIKQNDYTIKNVPSVFSGNVYPTAPCMGSSTVGGAGVGFGFSVGSSWTDDECGIRETSRSFSGLGKGEDALKVLCTSKYAAAAPSCAGAVAKE
jgi:hypothetical protein